MKLLIILLPLLLVLAGCGRKGALIPPEALVPAAVQNLSVQQQGADFRISWTAPAKEQGGRPLKDLSGFRLQRRDIAGDGSDCAACQESWKLLVSIDKDLPGETLLGGADYSYLDRGLPPGSSSQYRLYALSRSGGISQPATAPVRKLQPAVAAPVITAEVMPAAIRLAATFTAPPGSKLLGYNLYRRQGAAVFPRRPQNSAPHKQAVWDDQQLSPGQTYRYAATALVDFNGEIVESLPSAEVEVVYSLPELR